MAISNGTETDTSRSMKKTPPDLSTNLHDYNLMEVQYRWNITYIGGDTLGSSQETRPSGPRQQEKGPDTMG
jgi:hypothetical protein